MVFRLIGRVRGIHADKLRHPQVAGSASSAILFIAERLIPAGVWRIEVKVPNESDWVRVPATYRDYFEALVWATIALERWAEAEDVLLVPVRSDEVASEAASPPTDA